MYETVLFGAGSFWCLEPAFAALDGVIEANPGYTGGKPPFPSKNMVRTGLTGHIEVVQVIYDPAVIRFELLLDAFYSLHDPTAALVELVWPSWQQVSVIYYHTDKQKELAHRKIKQLTRERRYKYEVQTQVRPAERFWMSDPVDMNYFFLYGDKDRYCQQVIRPVLRKFARTYWEHLKLPEDKRQENPFMQGRRD